MKMSSVTVKAYKTGEGVTESGWRVSLKNVFA